MDPSGFDPRNAGRIGTFIGTASLAVGLLIGVIELRFVSRVFGAAFNNGWIA